ncbi:DUF11 domain-containing protein [Leifsonia sp. TF02-11]|uniref:beta strand repeat-containing protein n=1 Tax=Leifsonia sp. TF02-11 TaxID=2815212 RepID=UPI001AA0FF3C|nr:DUF11 domain-containing protein [Leifsonia sp. TF02-11]MBO1740594.1 hypothetical protein [Leifsonia sp. TF02-11]
MALSSTAPKQARRSAVAFGTVVALVLTTLALVWSSSSLPARAAGALLCNSTTIYGVVPDDPTVVNTVSSLISVDGASVGGAQLNAALISRSTVDGQSQNALALRADGTAAYSTADRGATVRRYDAISGTWSSFPGRPLVDPGDYVIAGGIDPTTGIFYFGDVGGTPSSAAVGQLFGFDTNTNTMISTTPLLTFPMITGENNGDIAFDGAGNLYIVTSSATSGDLQAVSGPLPRTLAQARATTPTVLSSFTVPPAAGGASVNGIAFDANGTLYLSLAGAAGGVFSIDPGTGTPQSSLTPLPAALVGPSGTGFVDLASCAFPPSVSVQKNVVSRLNPTDQFTLTATGPTIVVPATATTVGTTNGLQTTAGGQTLQAGPGLARFGDTYTATETAAGTTDLSRYVSSYRCVDEANPANPQFPITGTGTSVSFTLAQTTGETPAVVCTFTNAPSAPSLTLTKTANPTTVTSAGDPVTYTFQITNTGNTTLTGIGVNETAFSGTGTLPTPACDATTLAPAASTQCTTTYSVTAADFVAGTITNTAVAEGQDAGVGDVTSPPASAVVTATPPAPALALTKTANPTSVNAAGDTVTYTFHVTNTGNVEVTNLAIKEGSFTGTGTISAISCTATTLAPSASTDCTATYQATQADVDAGTITNTATATGDDPAGDTVTSPVADATVTAPNNSALTLTKTANPTTVTAAGQSVVYTFEVTNTGNTTLRSIAITETAFSGTGTLPPPTCAVVTLVPGESTQCTTTYATTAADLGASTIDNTAVATGLDPATGTVTSPDATAVVTVAPAVASLSLTKTANPTTVTAAGDTVTYTFHVTNTGNVPIDRVAIREGAFSGTGSLSPITCTASTLAPAVSADCTATYQATQADIDAGRITNDATATGDDPAGDSVTSPVADATVTAAPAPALALTKSVSPTSAATAGQTVTYSFLIENTGNVTITKPAAAEVTFTGTGTPPVIDCPTGVSLAPGDSTICTAPYTLTQADVDAGHVDNTAVATGSDTGTGTVTSNDSSVTLPVPPAPALTLAKSADPTTVNAAGQSVVYTFRVTNSGNTTITAVAISETAFTGTGAVPTPTCDATTLAPGESTRCTTTYTTTAADLGTTAIHNTAVATGEDPAAGAVTSPESSAVVTVITPAPALELTKTADPQTVTRAGDSITYRFRVTNTGNVTLTDVTVVEKSFSGTGGPLTLSCPSDTTLDAGDSLTCTADYRTTAADIAAGSITNTADATGVDPAGSTVTSQESRAVVQVTTADAPTPPANGDGLATTGSSLSGWLAPLAGLLALAGIGLAVIATRTRSKKNAR